MSQMGISDGFDLLLLEMFELVLLKVQVQLEAMPRRLIDSGEGSAGCGLSDALLVIVVLGDGLGGVGNEARRAESNFQPLSHTTPHM